MTLKYVHIVLCTVCIIVGPAQATDWWGKRLPNEPTNFIFGYGSLINSASRSATLGKAVQAIPVRVSALFLPFMCCTSVTSSGTISFLNLHCAIASSAR